MYRLLDKDREILLQLLTHFYTLQEPQSYSNYAELLGCDRRKVVKLAKLFKFDIDSNHWENIILLTTNDKDIHVTIGNDFSLDFFYSHYMQQSIGFILCWEIFNDRFTTIQDFATNVYMSRSSIYKRIHTLKEVLQDFDLNLDFTHPKIIVGKEHQIRYFFYQLFNEVFQTNHWPFDSLNIVFIDKFLVTFQKNYPHISTPTLIKLRMMIAVYLTRNQLNYWIDYSNSYFRLTNILIDFSDFQMLMQDFFNEHIIILNDYLEEELTFLYFFLTTLDSFELKHFETINAMKLDSISPYLELSKKWVNFFCSFFEILLQPKHYFFLLTNLTYLHHQVLSITGHSLTRYNSSFLSNQFNTQQSRVKHLSTFYQSLQNDENFSKLFQLQPTLPFSYALLTREVMKQLYPPLKILIYSKINTEQQNWLTEQIYQSLRIPIQVVTNLSENPSLVVSDFLVHSFIDSKAPLAYFLCQSFPTKKELDKLNQLAERIYFEKYTPTLHADEIY